MTDDTALTERLITVEAAIAHMRELASIREQVTAQRIETLVAHNRFQDQEQEKLAERLGKKIDEIQATLWSGLRWLGALFGTTLLSVVLKTLGLV